MLVLRSDGLTDGTREMYFVVRTLRRTMGNDNSSQRSKRFDLDFGAKYFKDLAVQRRS